jgi:hypothetical protein
MVRTLLASALLALAGVAMNACSDSYTTPSHGISADIAASHASGSASLLRSETPGFRDTDLWSRR